MSRILQCGMIGALCAFAAVNAGAQMRAARIAPAPPPAAPRAVAPVRVAPRPPMQVVNAGVAASRISTASNGAVTIVRPQQPIQQFDTSNGYPVPGLGFDYTDLAAFQRGARVTNFHNADRNGRRAIPFTPILFGGYPYYIDMLGGTPEYAPQPAPQQQPQVIIIQQPAPVVIVQAPGATTQATAAPQADSDAAAAAPANAEPPADPDKDAIILIRRDGKLFFASVYTVVGNELRYVTPEGIRHTLKLADLDVDATRGMNEARGSTIQLPN